MKIDFFRNYMTKMSLTDACKKIDNDGQLDLTGVT